MHTGKNSSEDCAEAMAKQTLRFLFSLVLLFTGLSFLSCTSNPRQREESELQPRDTPVQIGEVAPNFTLEAHNGEKVTLADARGKSPTVLVFYRGNW